jgi:hypothetical protein
MCSYFRLVPQPDRPRNVVPSGSVLVFYGAGVPVYLEPLHKRVVEGDYVGGDVAVVGLDVPDLQPLVVEAVELHGETYLLGNELVVLLALGLGGLVLIAFELFHREPAGAVENVKSITYPQAIRISLFQALAIVPGVSRSGATIVGGLAMDCPPFTCSNLRPNRKNGWKANQCTSTTVIAMNTAAKITSLGK